MLALPFPVENVLLAFAPLFTRPVWHHAQLLMLGAILARGKRTVASALRAVGLAQERRFTNYHMKVTRRVPASDQLLDCWNGPRPDRPRSAQGFSGAEQAASLSLRLVLAFFLLLIYIHSVRTNAKNPRLGFDSERKGFGPAARMQRA
jgi:hypothetical protein